MANGEASSVGLWLITSLSPLFTSHILLNLEPTGIRNAEGKNLARYYESDQFYVAEEYDVYRKNTSILIPMIGYRKLIQPQSHIVEIFRILPVLSLQNTCRSGSSEGFCLNGSASNTNPKRARSDRSSIVRNESKAMYSMMVYDIERELSRFAARDVELRTS